MATADRKAFRNDSGGFLGAIQYSPRGEEKAVSVAPGEIVWLSKDEVQATANSHKSALANPFIEQKIPLQDSDGNTYYETRPPQFKMVDGDRPIPSWPEGDAGDEEAGTDVSAADLSNPPQGTAGDGEESGSGPTTSVCIACNFPNGSHARWCTPERIAAAEEKAREQLQSGATA